MSNKDGKGPKGKGLRNGTGKGLGRRINIAGGSKQGGKRGNC